MEIQETIHHFRVFNYHAIITASTCEVIWLQHLLKDFGVDSSSCFAVSGWKKWAVGRKGVQNIKKFGWLRVLYLVGISSFLPEVAGVGHLYRGIYSSPETCVK